MKIAQKYLVSIPLIMLLAVVLFNCKKDNIAATPEVIVPVVIPDTSVVNRFIYNGLKLYYLWEDRIPEFTAQKYTNKDTLNAFLNSFKDPQKLFTGLLYQYKTVDKWSFMVADPKIISDWIQGISETMGFDFMLARVGTAGDVFGFVRYVLKGSPADKAGIKRGDLFTKVNDQQLTVSNYQTLLLNTLTYKLSMATISGNTISLNGKSYTMTAVLMQENPVLLDTILNVSSGKDGYLVYNAFNAVYDLKLDSVFLRFKNAGISNLILDLRYNGGGSVQTAVYLASMIYGTNTAKIFIKNQYNPALQAEIISYYGTSTILNQNFTNVIAKTSTTAEAPINTLNLSKVYVITSDNTASASELLINGLKPYMQVVQVGDTTVGKYVASTTIQEADVYDVPNPKDTYAMQPIIMKYYNSAGVSDFVTGLIPDPDKYIKEDFTNLIAFGNPNETILKGVLNLIQGLPLKSIPLRSAQMGMKKIFDAQDSRPFAKQMYINSLPKIGR